MRLAKPPVAQTNHQLISEPCGNLYDWNVIRSMQVESPSRATYIVGDMQGNAFKLIVFLHRLGFVTLTQNSFHSLLQLYLLAEEMQTWGINDLLQSKINLSDPNSYAQGIDTSYLTTIRQFLHDYLLVNPAARNARLVLVGDLLCDRGKCDILTLCLMEWMAQHGIQFTITLSNHDLLFLQACEKHFSALLLKEAPYNDYRSCQSSSPSSPCFISMLTLFTASREVKAAMHNIVHSVYLPRLRIADYDLITRGDGSTQMYLYTHTPFNADYFARIPQSKNCTGLETDGIAALIDHVNEHLRGECSMGIPFFSQQSASLHNFVWNRDKPSLALSRSDIINVFGHVNTQLPLQFNNLFNLDFDGLGRPGSNSGNLLALRVSKDSQSVSQQQFAAAASTTSLSLSSHTAASATQFSQAVKPGVYRFSVVTCSHCDEENRSSEVFCKGCGHLL